MISLSRRALLAGTAVLVAAPSLAFARTRNTFLLLEACLRFQATSSGELLPTHKPLPTPESLFELLAGGVIADGRAVSLETYGNLHAIIGGRFGEDLEAGTFNLPDLRPTLVETGEKCWFGEHYYMIYTGDASLWNLVGDTFWKMPITVWDLSV